VRAALIFRPLPPLSLSVLILLKALRLLQYFFPAQFRKLRPRTVLAPVNFRPMNPVMNRERNSLHVCMHDAFITGALPDACASHGQTPPKKRGLTISENSPSVPVRPPGRCLPACLRCAVHALSPVSDPCKSLPPARAPPSAPRLTFPRAARRPPGRPAADLLHKACLPP
jgi:hypothetical protein